MLAAARSWVPHDGFQIKAQPLAVAAANRQSNGEYGTEAKRRPSGLHCVSKEYGVERQARWCSTTGRGTRGTVSRGRGTADTRRRGPRTRLLDLRGNRGMPRGGRG